MKKIKDVIYGFAVWTVTVLNLVYLIMVTYNGISNVDDYSIEGVGLFAYIICTSIVIIRYPLKIWITNTVKFLKTDIDTKKKKNTKVKQIKAA